MLNRPHTATPLLIVPLVFLMLALCGCPTGLLGPAFNWVARAGGTGYDEASSIGASADGTHIVTVGAFEKTAVFGLGQPTEAPIVAHDDWNRDLFVAKYNKSDGTLVWVKGAGGSGEDAATSVSVMPDGSCIVVGFFENSIIFGTGDPTQTTLTAQASGDKDIFIARFNANGSLAWAKRAGNLEDDAAFSVSAMNDGSCVVAGYFVGTATFGPGEGNATTLQASTAGDKDLFVASYAANGSLIWASRAGGAGEDAAASISIVTDGSCLVTGYFQGSAAFGHGEARETTLLTSAGWSTGAFVARYNTNGTLSWAKAAYSPVLVAGAGVSALQDGSCVVTGTFEGAGVFGDGEPNKTTIAAPTAWANQIFLAKYNSSGTLAWAKGTGGTGSGEALGVGTLSTGESWITGRFRGQTAFTGAGTQQIVVNALTPSALDSNLFAARFNGDGTVRWALAIDGGNPEQASSIKVLSNGSSLLAGSFYGSTQIVAGQNQLNITAAGREDILLLSVGP